MNPSANEGDSLIQRYVDAVAASYQLVLSDRDESASIAGFKETFGRHREQRRDNQHDKEYRGVAPKIDPESYRSGEFGAIRAARDRCPI